MNKFNATSYETGDDPGEYTSTFQRISNRSGFYKAAMLLALVASDAKAKFDQCIQKADGHKPTADFVHQHQVEEDAIRIEFDPIQDRNEMLKELLAEADDNTAVEMHDRRNDDVRAPTPRRTPTPLPDLDEPEEDVLEKVEPHQSDSVDDESITPKNSYQHQRDIIDMEDDSNSRLERLKKAVDLAKDALKVTAERGKTIVQNAVDALSLPPPDTIDDGHEKAIEDLHEQQFQTAEQKGYGGLHHDHEFEKDLGSMKVQWKGNQTYTITLSNPDAAVNVKVDGALQFNQMPENASTYGLADTEFEITRDGSTLTLKAIKSVTVEIDGVKFNSADFLREQPLEPTEKEPGLVKKALASFWEKFTV